MPVTTEITKSNDRKNLKKTQCISSQRIIMEEKYKIKKKHNKFEHEFKMTFFLSEDVETLGKNDGASTSILAHFPKSKLSIMLNRI